MMNLRNYSIPILLLLTAAMATKAQTDTVGFNYQKPLFDFDYKKQVFKLEGEQAENTNRFYRSSVLTGYREGVKPFAGLMNSDVFNDDKAETSKFCWYNLSIQDMLTNGAKADQVVLNVKDPSKYRYDPKYGSEKDWLRKNGYCYEMTLPWAVVNSNLVDRINKDIAGKFHVTMTIERRNEIEFYIITEVNH